MDGVEVSIILNIFCISMFVKIQLFLLFLFESQRPNDHYKVVLARPDFIMCIMDAKFKNRSFGRR